LLQLLLPQQLLHLFLQEDTESRRLLSFPSSLMNSLDKRPHHSLRLSSASDVKMKLEDALILRNLDPAKENLETEDTLSERDHLLFTMMKIQKLPDLPETLLELTLAMFTDSIFLNLLQEVPSEDSSFGLTLLSKHLMTFSEPTRETHSTRADTLFKETSSKLPIFPDSLTQMQFNQSSRLLHQMKSFIKERRIPLETREL